MVAMGTLADQFGLQTIDKLCRAEHKRSMINSTQISNVTRGINKVVHQIVTNQATAVPMATEL